MEKHVERGRMLYSSSRYDAAEAELRKALAEEPGDFIALGFLALSIAHQDRPDEALATAQEAVGHGPDEPYPHFALALVHFIRDEYLKSKAAVLESLRLDDEAPWAWALLANIHIVREEYTEALDAANHGLEIDPEDSGCQNFKALALTQLGRHREAAATIKGQLQRDPDDAMTHANQGWAELHANNPKQAAIHFREALRLEPELEFARVGMLNALRARNPIFRLLLAYFLWMSRLSQGARWGVIIGGVFGVKLLRQAAKHNPSLMCIAIPVIVLYLLFVFITWTGPILANLLLRLDKFGRHVLSKDEIRASNYVGVSLGLSILFGIAAAAGWLCATSPAAMTTWALLPAMAAGLFLLMILPLAGTLNTSDRKWRIALSVYTGLLFACGAAAVAMIHFSPNRAGLPGALFVIGLVLYTWLGSVVCSQRPD
ncbi:MAG: tetratricopeptide repeat protein [Phycisphaerae bacterium]|nr:tetratricopeptide repeat protein [Phycisphaerae bacterium]